jgi:hypothetical protein
MMLEVVDVSNLKNKHFDYLFSTFFNLENSEVGLFMNLVDLVEGPSY